jgi:hypothetical protein
MPPLQLPVIIIRERVRFAARTGVFPRLCRHRAPARIGRNGVYLLSFGRSFL